MSGSEHFSLERVKYLRISVTDRCNLRCRYCLASGVHDPVPGGSLLTFEEIAEVTCAAAELGVSTVRLTGGEPLLRTDLADLVSMIKAIKVIDDIAMTTNALLLEQDAGHLKKAGLRRVNVSLDTLRPERFKNLTGSDAQLQNVLAGIDAAVSTGLVPVKINVVCIRGSNDDEIPDLVLFGARKGIVVRFIEQMRPANETVPFIRTNEIRTVIERTFGVLSPYRGIILGKGPARYFSVPGAGTIGFISPMSDPFCRSCDRLRLRADGRLFRCLVRSQSIDTKDFLRPFPRPAELRKAIRSVIQQKNEDRNHIPAMVPPNMNTIGG